MSMEVLTADDRELSKGDTVYAVLENGVTMIIVDRLSPNPVSDSGLDRGPARIGGRIGGVIEIDLPASMCWESEARAREQTRLRASSMVSNHTELRDAHERAIRDAQVILERCDMTDASASPSSKPTGTSNA